jgi:HK97 family phage major capsid protein/HK97 family phage prohead protease
MERKRSEIIAYVGGGGQRFLTFSVSQKRPKIIDEEQRVLEFSFMSGTPVKRWFGTEILEIENPNSTDMARLQDGAPLLWGHDDNQVIGVVEKAWMQAEENGEMRGYVRVRFSTASQKAREIWEDVKSGIIRNVSYRYTIDDYEVVENEKDFTLVVKAHTPSEVSLVAVPADPSVGLSRKLDLESKILNIEPTQKKETITMGAENLEEIARKREIDRTEKIFALAEAHQKTDLARKAVREGMSYDDFKDTILRELGKSPSNVLRGIHEDRPPIGLTQREAGNFNIARAIKAKLDGDFRGLAPFEYEVSMAAGRRAQKNGNDSIIVPIDVLMSQRAPRTDVVSATTPPPDPTKPNVGQSEFYHGVPDRLDTSRFIDDLYASTVIMRAGAQEIGPLDPGIVSIPKLKKSTGAAAWYAEDEEAQNSKIAVKQIELSPRRISSTSILTRNVLMMSALPAQNLVMNDFKRAIALAIDAAAFTGSHATDKKSPQGIFFDPDTQKANEANAALSQIDFTQIVRLETMIEEKDAAIGPITYITSPTLKGYLKHTPEANTAGSKMIWTTTDLGEGYVNGCRAFTTTNVKPSATAGELYIVAGCFSSMILANWGYLEFIINPYTEDTRGNVRITCHMEVDVALRYPEAFAVRTRVKL